MSLSAENIQVKKSNPLIQSMGTPTVLANQLLLTALVHAEMADPLHPSPVISKEDWKRISEVSNADYTKGLVAIFPQSEIRKYSGRANSGSYYSGLEIALNSSPKSKAEGAKALANQWEIIINSRGVHEHVSLITASAYDTVTKTVFIKFSDEEKVQKHIYNLQKNYTTLSYQQMMKFKTNYASKLYELLKSRIDYDDNKEGVIKQHYEYTYNVAHLKFMLGVLNPFNSNETIKLLGHSNPDYDAIADKISTGNEENGWPKWYDFKRYCLIKCKKEISELTEFNMDFAPGEKKGNGGRVVEVVITVDRKTDVLDSKNKEITVTDDEKYDLIDKVKELIEEPLSTKEIISILEASGYNLEKVKKQYDNLKKANNVENVVGWMINAIKNNYKPSVTRKKKHSFTGFEQSSVDFDEIERLLVDN